MSSRAPGILGRIIKWVIVPILLAAIGVFGVGPYLGKVGVPIAERFKKAAPPKVVPVEEQTSDSGKYGAPQVEVTVAPGASHVRSRVSSEHSATRHRRRHRHTKKPAAPPTDAAPDNGTAPTPPPEPATAG